MLFVVRGQNWKTFPDFHELKEPLETFQVTVAQKTIK